MLFSFEHVGDALDRYLEFMAEQQEIPNYFPINDDSASQIHSSRLDYEGTLGEQTAKIEKIEIGYFHLLNCDIKASEDMIRQRYLIKTEELITNHMQSKEFIGNRVKSTEHIRNRLKT